MNMLILALDVVMPADVRDADVLVVAPAVNSRLRHWLSDEDDARRRAEGRAAALVDRLERVGIHAEGRVGDADPLLAIADALPTFPADEIVIAAPALAVGRRRRPSPGRGAGRCARRAARTSRRPCKGSRR